MGDESTSEVEMGNKHGGGGKKKKNKSNGSAETVTSGEVSDSDNEYKYVSIIDVNPPSPQFHSATESLCQSIEVNSPPNGEVLKCSVIIGEKPQENGHSVSRVSVNGGDFDDFLDELPNGSSSFIEKVPNGSSSFIEDIRTSQSPLIEVVPNESPSRVIDISNGFPSKVNEVPNGSSTKVNETPKGSPLLDKVLNGSSFEHLLKRDSLKEFLGKDTDDILWGSSIIDKSLSTTTCDEMDSKNPRSHFSSTHDNNSDDSNSPPYEMANGSSQSGDETNKESFSLEDRLEQAVRETLGGSGLDESQVQEEVERVVREKLKRQRSGSSDYWNHDDSEDHCIVDFLDKINDHAEARLAAKRQARAEAREIRMRELERMQRESEDGDRVYDVYSTPEAVNKCVRAGSVATPRSLLSANNSYHSSRRSSEDSLEEVNNIRDVRHELKELEEKFRKAMIANAQLDNEKAAVAYQVDLLKDRYEELEEQNLQLLREHKETCRQLEQTRRHRTKLQEDLDVSRSQLSELAQLIQEKGLVVVEGDCSSSDEESEGSQPRPKKPPKKALVSAEVADVLQQGTGSLDVRLKKFVEERNELVDELRRVKLQLEEERAHSRGRHANGPTDTDEDIQREANKLLGDYKFKLQKAEQDVNTLQANVARLESQVVRYKSAAETSEKLEDELKLEKRKLQRELREAQARVEELETSHSHLQRRLDKLKNAKSALLKDL